MKVRIEFPDDLAQQKADEAREWRPGDPMVWEAEDINVEPKVEVVGDVVVLQTEHTRVELSPEEIAKIKEL